MTVSGAGSVALRDTNAITINASTVNGALSVQAGGALTVAGAISAAGAGDAIVLSGSRFVNSVGAAALSAANGRWLVWSSNTNPFGGASPDARNGLTYDFKQYSATFGVTPVAQATGNGFLYSLAPSIAPGLTGTTGRVYDGTTAATLLAGNFTAAGAVDGDAVTLASREHIRRQECRRRQGRYRDRHYGEHLERGCAGLRLYARIHHCHREHRRNHAGVADGDGAGGHPRLRRHHGLAVRRRW